MVSIIKAFAKITLEIIFKWEVKYGQRNERKNMANNS